MTKERKLNLLLIEKILKKDKRLKEEIVNKYYQHK